MSKALLFKLLLFSFLSISFTLFSQPRGVLVVSGRMEANKRPVTDGVIKVYQNNSLQEELHTNMLGRFEFYTQFDSDYLVEFSAPGMVSKKLNFNTQLPERYSRRNFFEFDFVIELFPKIEEIDLSFLDNPLATIKFDSDDKNEFYFPEEMYSESLNKAIDLQRQVEAFIRRDSRFDDLVRRADDMFDREDFDNALSSYMSASEIYPEREHPLARINEIREILAQRGEVQELYRQLIKLADNNFEIENYEAALEHYGGASEVRPDADYPRQRIDEINRLIARRDVEKVSQAHRDSLLRVEALVTEKYDSLIFLADNNFDDNLLTQARGYYTAALKVKPGEQHPEDRILTINRMLRETMEAEVLYKDIIKRADSLFDIQRYQSAMDEYREALEVKPGETYPVDQIASVESLIAEKRQRDEAYAELISEADRLFINRSYESARAEYEKALGLKPAEVYPKQRMEEISEILGRRDREFERYNTAIRRGDQYLGQGNYLQARDAYQDALTMRAGEAYPRIKLAEVEELLAAERSESLDYQQNVELGDRLFNQMQYFQARDAYHRALNASPGADYPVRRIQEINELIVRGEEMDAFYAKGYMEVSGAGETIKNNSKNTYHIVPFSRHRSGSYIEMKVVSKAERNIRIFVNYGVGKSDHGGIAVTVPPSEDAQSIRLNVSSQTSWISYDNNWISLSPVGGDLGVDYINIVFGN